jgi:uncharacterized protein YndB with AHSA1/START domain
VDPDGFRLHLAAILPAVRSRLFRAHTNKDELAQWWGPTGFTTPTIQLDARVGGTYRITMQPPQGDPFHLSGEFVEIDPPSRLVYTFRWEEPDPDDRETLVTITLSDRGGSTELTVDQGVFATEARLALHEQGWAETLERLRAFV